MRRDVFDIISLARARIDQSEMVIQELLAEAGESGFDRQPVSVDAGGIEAAADWRSLRSAENYVGL